MKGLTSTLALAVVLAGLGAYIYFVDSKKPAADAPVKAKVFTVDAGAVSELTLKASDGEVTTLRRGAGGWQVVAPVQADADANEPNTLTSSLATLELNRIVDDNPSNLKEFELDPPRMEISFLAAGAKEPQRLLIGGKTPPGTDLYAKLPGAPRVFLIPSFVENTFNRTTFDLRDKGVLKAERGTVERIDITSGAGTLQFVRKSEVEWNITAPQKVRGDFGAIDGLLNSLLTGQVQKFVANEAKDAPEYGFAKPAVSVTLSGGGKQAVFTVGAEVDGTHYAKDSTRPLVFTVGNNLVKDLGKALTDFRRRDLFDFRVFNASKVTIARGAETLSIERVKKGTEAADEWKTGGGKTLEMAKGEEPLLKLSNLKAESFTSDQPAALRSPTLTVTATFDDGKSTEVVRFARSGADVYAVRQDDPGVARLPAAVYDEAVKALDALK